MGAYVMPILLHAEGVEVSFILITIVIVIGFVVELTSTVGTSGKTLEELESEAMQGGPAVAGRPAGGVNVPGG